jgi:hypothetical protein
VQRHAGMRQFWPLSHAGRVRSAQRQAVREKHDVIDTRARRVFAPRASLSVSEHGSVCQGSSQASVSTFVCPFPPPNSLFLALSLSLPPPPPFPPPSLSLLACLSPSLSLCVCLVLCGINKDHSISSMQAPKLDSQAAADLLWGFDVRIQAITVWGTTKGRGRVS